MSRHLCDGGLMRLPSIDSLLDATVVPGFSRIGYEVRSRAKGWTPLSAYDLSEVTVAVTGVTSGIGAAAARQFRALGADLVVVGRDASRTERAADGLRAGAGTGSVASVLADMAELEQVADAARQIAADHPSVSVLVHNAGALLKERRVTSTGDEVTISAQVLGPHLLTTLLLPQLRAAGGRVVTVASGGMYAAPLPDISAGHALAMSPERYDGTKQYAIAKRAQVTLNEMWAEREPAVHFHCMHPGWADTPGVQDSLPMFRRITKPVLRTSEQGADTVIWLAADAVGGTTSGGFWCDRARRPIHRIPSTTRSDTPAARQALWAWVAEQTGSFVP
jgi:NAD(P)-dependent dehydrogenase (short-subunit alcohol dehydrogenase family)